VCKSRAFACIPCIYDSPLPAATLPPLPPTGRAAFQLTAPLQPPQAWPSLVLLDFPNIRETYSCTGTVIHVSPSRTFAVALTSATCLPAESRGHDTGGRNWLGAAVALPPGAGFVARTGDGARTVVGNLTSAAYVFTPTAGGNLAAVAVALDPAAAPVAPAAWLTADVPMWQPGVILGFGAGAVAVTRFGPVSVVTPSGGGALRSAVAYVTDVSGAAGSPDDCHVPLAAGDLYVEDLRGAFNAFRVCVTHGDDGAPLFVDTAAGSGGAPAWRLAGVAVTTTDHEACGGLRTTLTSVPFRDDWIRVALNTLAGVPYARPPCPSLRPTATPTPSRSPSPALAAAPSRDPSPSPPAVPFASRPLNLLWIIIMAVFLGTVVACTAAWGWRARAQVAAGTAPSADAKAALASAPPAAQVAGSAAAPSAADAEAAAIRAAAREGEFVSYPRRMSEVAGLGAAAVAAAVAARAAHRAAARRRSADGRAPGGGHAPPAARRSFLLPHDREFEGRAGGLPPVIGWRFNYGDAGGRVDVGAAAAAAAAALAQSVGTAVRGDEGGGAGGKGGALGSTAAAL
jgi:hypothetical protein